MKKDDFISKSKYTEDKINSHREILIKIAGEKRAEMVFFQLEELIVLTDSYELERDNNLTLVANKEFLTDEEKTIIEEAYLTLKLSYDALNTINKDALKIHFKGLTPSSTKKKPELILKGLKRGYVAVKNPEFVKLNRFKSEYELSIEKLDKMLSKTAKYSSILESTELKVQALSESWELSYGQLKLYVKAALLKSEYDYKDFFLDLGNKTSSSKDNKEDKSSNNESDTPKI